MYVHTNILRNSIIYNIKTWFKYYNQTNDKTSIHNNINIIIYYTLTYYKLRINNKNIYINIYIII